MTLGTGPQALLEVLRDGWQASRTGRPDVPPLVPKGDERTENGVLLVRDRSDVRVQQDRHDLIHVYQPEASPGAITDTGFDSQREVETVQIDIEVTDRNDDVGNRTLARTRMFGDINDPALAELGKPPYIGISGEVQYILETVRRGVERYPYDKITYDEIKNKTLNSSSTVKYTVDLIQLAKNTVK